MERKPFVGHCTTLSSALAISTAGTLRELTKRVRERFRRSTKRGRKTVATSAFSRDGETEALAIVVRNRSGYPDTEGSQQNTDPNGPVFFFFRSFTCSTFFTPLATWRFAGRLPSRVGTSCGPHPSF